MSVYEAWAKVMQDVQAVGKNERVTEGPARFNFRGIDTVMNAVGPALRAHGVTVVPTADHIELERYQTSRGSLMQGAIVRMRYTVYGPDGDHFEGAAYGQAADSGDKAVSKAESVAYRMFLLQALTIPTDEPDPDYENHQRVVEPEPVRDPRDVARSALGQAVVKSGMEPAAFADWATETLSVDLRSADVETLQGLTRRVEAEGAAMCGAVAE